MLSCLIIIAACTTAAATTRYVSLDGSNEAPYLTPETAARSIQDALDASGWGDAVVLAEGEYRESVTMKRGLTLVGTGDCAILPPSSQTRILLTMAYESTIFGLSILGDRCGVLVDAAGASIIECEISNSLAFRWGYGVQVQSGGEVLISRCRLVGNQYGLWSRPDSVAVLLDCEIHDNSYGVWGSRSSSIVAARCDVHHNYTGISTYWGGLLTVSNCRFTDNGEALGVQYGFQLISGCLIVRNEMAVQAYGENPRPILVHCTIAMNRWGIHESARATIRDSIVWGNSENVTEATDPAHTSHSLIGDDRFVGVNGNLDGEPGFVGWAPFNDSDNPIHVDASAPPGGDGTSEAPLTLLSAALHSYDFRLSSDSPCVGAATDGGNLGAIQEVASIEHSSRVRINVAPGTYDESEEARLIVPSGTKIYGTGDNCTIRGGRWGPSLMAIDDVLIRRMRMEEAGVRLLGGRLEDCCFERGGAVTYGGQVSRCRFLRGALAIAGPTLVTNCVFSGAGENRGIRNSTPSHPPSITNCTIYGYETGLEDWDASVIVRNCVIWGNAKSIESYPQIDAAHCLIEGGYPGEGNIDGDPMFVDGENGDFRLLPDSLCIDAGFNDPELPETDNAGMHRIMFGGKSLTVDMGAYEFYINELKPLPDTDEAIFTWSSFADKTYAIFHTDDLLTWHLAVESFPSAGNQTTSWTDDGSLTGLPPSLAPRRFYRLLENP